MAIQQSLAVLRKLFPSTTKRRELVLPLLQCLSILLVVRSVPPGVEAAAGPRTDAALLDSMFHDITLLTPQNFDSQVTKKRTSQVNAVMFYKKNDESRQVLHGVYNQLAKDVKGMVTVGAVDCDEYPMLCEQHNAATGHPLLNIYPLNPFPPYKYEGLMGVTELKNALFRLIPTRNMEMISPENVDKLLAKAISVPKVLFFSSKPNPAVLFKAISNAFESKLHFGYVDSSNPANEVLLSRWSITSSQLPRVVLLKHDSKQPLIFKDKEITFPKLFEWLNVFAETFVLGGGFSDHPPVDLTLTKPWLAERVPEVTTASHQDVCFSKSAKSKGLCVIYLKAGRPLSAEETIMLELLSEQFTSHLAGRGATFRWMWMDLSLETGFGELFEVSEESIPSVVVFNPHKRLRFTSLPAGTPANADTIKQLLDKITGGDARFQNVKGQTLPAFADRGDDEKKQAPAPKKEEL
eukprot:GHVS01029150.1.p1 GENE.GHVS01029150.1~~GHVS01029150.1.p1  ORF type:complete len:465 (-),score=67.09 GHVS01029150.1:250-1644(-)